ncbi:MAG TPA: tetrahydrofolate dehydrogenase/cyclohydrolase catalytic domain-containing protein, partial [bacterium]|nr:tetrahydrofolate dehydrogenase/cyclohydrolase catalytic domain-containing protein [bacterium]
MLLDGTRIGAEIRREVAGGVAALRRERGVVPGIAFVSVGDDPASRSYVAMKEKGCAEVGIRSRQCTFPAAVGKGPLLETTRLLNLDPAIHGILVQLPLPPGIDALEILSAVSPEK